MCICMFVEEEKTRVSHYKIRGKTIETRYTFSSYSRVVVIVTRWRRRYVTFPQIKQEVLS